MKQTDFIFFINRLDYYDRKYLVQSFEKQRRKFNIQEVIKLTNLYNRLTTKNSTNNIDPLSHVAIFHLMNAWCKENCKDKFQAISVTNWAFENPQDAMRFKLVWDRNEYDSLV